MTSRLHIPVLKEVVTKYFDPGPGLVFLDATIGAAGHAIQLASLGASVIGLDQDQEILKVAKNEIDYAGLTNKIQLHHAHFSKLDVVVGKTLLDGALFDLGISSLQLNSPQRGFSFRYDAPLDMRMDTKLQVTAADLLGGLGRKELHELFTKLGEQEHSRKLADVIVKSRRLKPITTTTDLVKIVDQVIRKTKRIHPATKVFQALRIAVNDELNELKKALPLALNALKANGTLIVISFHSLEDRIVKEFFRDQSDAGSLEILTKKPITPAKDEVINNPRSRSAKLRAAKLIAGKSNKSTSRNKV